MLLRLETNNMNSRYTPLLNGGGAKLLSITCSSLALLPRLTRSQTYKVGWEARSPQPEIDFCGRKKCYKTVLGEISQKGLGQMTTCTHDKSDFRTQHKALRQKEHEIRSQMHLTREARSIISSRVTLLA